MINHVYLILKVFRIMETYEVIYKTICRVCLLRGNDDNMVPLFDSNSHDGFSPYGKAVKTFAHVTLQKDDYLPQTMCAKCLLLLKQAIFFKFTCESSEKHLRNINNSTFSKFDNMKEKVVEFIMYRQIFPKESFETPLKRLAKIKKKAKIMEINEHVPELATEESNGFNVDYSSFDNLDDTQVMSKDEEENEHLLQKLERIVESSGSYIDSDFKRVKFKRKLKILKIRPKAMKTSFKNTQKFACPICKKVLANSQTYYCHMQRHNGFRLICEHCGKGFPILAELQAHQVTKHGTGPYLQCQHCPFKAPRKFDLIEHERLHTGERPFACEKCGLTFRRRAIWKKHLIYHSEKKIQCNQCPRKFHQKSEMLAHCNNVHDRMYVYSCNKCGATYAKTSTVRRHMTEKHGIPREMQGKVIRINKGSVVHEQ